MGWKNRLVERGKQLAMTPRVLRVISDDRVMKAAEGVMDARIRMRAAASKAGEAWQLLTRGHDLPSIDPSIDDDLPTATISAVTQTNGNGHAVHEKNGSAHANGNGVATTAQGEELAASMASRTSLAAIGGRDVFEKAFQFRAAD